MPVITNAGEYLITQQQQAGEPLIIDQMILANITGLDSNTVPSREQSMPAPADVKIIKPITKDGLLNTNTVVYSTVFPSTDGTFDFNYMGLYSSAHDVIVAVAYVPLQTKIKTVGTDVGNVITKNFAIEFNAAADITGINISAESWQIDYTARLLSMDKHQRDLVKNIYGPSTFLNDAFKVKFEADKYYLTAGKAILGGINFDLEADLEIVPGALPQTVWLDVYQETSMMGVLNKHDVVINDGTVLTDYVAGSVEHTLVKLGVVNSSVDIVDGRSVVCSDLSIYSNKTLENFGIKANGINDDTVDFLLMAEKLENTGKTVSSRVGDVIHLTEPVAIKGFIFRLVKGSSIKISGADASLFTGGAVIVKENALLTGGGDIYTSGILSHAAGSHTVRQDDGVVNGVTIYSQFDEAYIHFRGYCKVNIVGGFGRGFRSRLNTDEPVKLDISYHNVGIRYSDKSIMTPIIVPSDSRAVNIIPTIPINSLVEVNVNGDYSWKNGAWLGYRGVLNDNSVDLNNLVTSGYIKKSGFYLDENGNEQSGHGAGTCWEILAAPNAILNGSSDSPRGYNIAIAAGSHGAVSSGRHIGLVGDPNCVVVASNNVIIGGTLLNGTVGVSVGEDGDQADGCIIEARIVNAANEPVRVSAAKNTRISGASIEGVTAGSANGSWSGLGKVSPVVRALREQYGANDIIIENTTISGPYTHDVIEKGNGGIGGDSGLRVVRSANTYNCALIPHDEAEMQNLLGIKSLGSSRFTPLTTISPSGGYSDTGEIIITEAGGLTYAFTTLDSKFNNLDSHVKSGDTRADTLKNLYVLWYFRYDSAMVNDSNRLARFGLSTSGNASHVAQSFYAVFSAYETMLGRPLKNGEYLPFRIPMNDLIYSGADTANLVNFVFSVDDVPVGYDLVITAPVVVECR